jgi:hypothetical protein
VSGRNSRESRRRALEEARQSQLRRQRTRRIAVWGGAIAVVAAAGTGIGLGLSGSSPGSPSSPSSSYAALSSLGALGADPAPGALGPEEVPVPSAPALAAPSAATAGQSIDGIGCDTSEQPAFHIHTHLAIFVDGQQRQVPAGIGIPGAVAEQTASGPFVSSGKCFYFLHTHSPDGIIHIESPVVKTYTLGEFFDEWQQPLSASQVGPATGKVTAIVNGEVYRGDPRGIPLGSREDVTLEVGTPLLAPESINWSVTGL